MFSNYYGYGFSDHKLKYGIQFKIRDKEKKSLQLKINYKNEVNKFYILLGRNLDILKNKNY